MKKLIFLLVAGQCSLSAIAQDKGMKPYTADRDLSPWVLDINFLGGTFNQTMDMAPTAPNYLNGININTGNAGFKRGSALGGDIQLGYFFGRNKHWGIGTGLHYMRDRGNVTLDKFHAEYQSVDNNGYIFRQVVTAGPINEELKIDNFNIPLVLKYKNRFSKHWGFTADAGALFNLQMKSKYTTNASFDYEAIYKFVPNEQGMLTPVYETSIIPDNSDFLITQSHFIKNNPTGNVQDYFNAKRDEGYNVGLGVKPKQQEGSASYKKGSIGFILQPSVNYFFSDRVALNVGAYYSYQSFKNENTGSYVLTGRPGEYSSVVNSVSTVQTQSFGGNVGLRFFLGKKAPAMNISSTDQYNPTACGANDGSFVLHGLKAGEKATVNYHVNGAATATTYPAIVSNEGAVTVPGLGAGNYTDIKATVGKKSAGSNPVKLVAPELVIGDVETENPSGAGKCDGTIRLYGMQAGANARVDYTINGVKASYSNIVASDKSIKVTGLCAGTITNVTVTSNNCKAQLNRESIVVSDPQRVVETVTEVTTDEDVMTQILFDFNTSNLRPTSYAVIDRAYEQMQKDPTSYVVIDGNTDEIGTDAYNQKLSERRAAVVRAYLIKKGIPASRIQNYGNGEKEPVASNNTTEGRRKNRRAEILIRIKK